MANPTTNYGFVLPTSSDLVTDLPADFDVALQGVDTRLKALNPSTTLGDINYASATANTNTRLGIGTSGQVLAVSGGVPSWTTISSGGWTSIASGNLPVGSALAITGIPTTYFQLVLIIRNAVTSGVQSIPIRFNNNSTAGAYLTGRSSGEAASATMTDEIVSSSLVSFATSGTDDVANNLAMTLTVDNYASTVSDKLYNGQIVYSTNGSDYRIENVFGGFKSTSAITEINVARTTFTAGTYVLYGVK
jgi:hypothetical protein